MDATRKESLIGIRPINFTEPSTAIKLRQENGDKAHKSMLIPILVAPLVPAIAIGITGVATGISEGAGVVETMAIATGQSIAGAQVSEGASQSAVVSVENSPGSDAIQPEISDEVPEPEVEENLERQRRPPKRPASEIEPKPGPSRPDTSNPISSNQQDTVETDAEENFEPDTKKGRYEESQLDVNEDRSLEPDENHFAPESPLSEASSSQGFQINYEIIDAPGSSLINGFVHEVASSLDNIRNVADHMALVLTRVQSEIRAFGLHYVNAARDAGLFQNLRQQIRVLGREYSELQVNNLNMEEGMQAIVRRVSGGRTANEQLNIIHDIEMEQADADIITNEFLEE